MKKHLLMALCGLSLLWSCKEDPKQSEEYKKLIAAWRDVLPTQSVCLSVPVVPLDETGTIHAAHQAEVARRMVDTLPTSASLHEQS